MRIHDCLFKRKNYLKKMKSDCVLLCYDTMYKRLWCIRATVKLETLCSLWLLISRNYHIPCPQNLKVAEFIICQKNEKQSSFMFINSAISELKSKADIRLLHVCPPYREIDEKMHRNRNYKIVLEISKYVKASWYGR